MINYGHLLEYTLTWNKIQNTLQLARDITGERAIYTRHSHIVSSMQQKHNS